MDFARLATAVRAAEEFTPVRGNLRGFPLRHVYHFMPEQLRNMARQRAQGHAAPEARLVNAYSRWVAATEELFEATADLPEEEARKAAEAQRKTEAKRRAEEEEAQRQQAEEAKRTEDGRKQEEAEATRKAEEEARRQAEQEEEEAKRAEEEAERKKLEEESRRRLQEEKVALDLEQYDLQEKSRSPIRAIEYHLPPRIAVREKATVESPHILVLIDDPERSVIEPLFEKSCKGYWADIADSPRHSRRRLSLTEAAESK